MRFFTSDTHFNHERIIELCDRPFRDRHHMNEELIRRWNETVHEDDVVFHLGDVALGPRDEWDDILSQLNGYIKLIPGNHDRCSPVMSKDAKLEREIENYCKWFVMGDEVETIHLLGLMPVTVSHYPFVEYEDERLMGRVFPGMPKDDGTPLIHGHTHEKDVFHLSPKGTPMVHVGMDAWDYRPVPEIEIAKLLFLAEGWE